MPSIHQVGQFVIKQLCSAFGLVISLTLSACGGGAAPVTKAPDPVVTPPTVPDPVPPTPLPIPSNFSYSDPALQSMFNALTVLRITAGAGPTIQKSPLDLAAKRHADYLVNNNLTSNGAYLYQPQENGQWGGHYESMVNLGFTGATPQVRANAAGYVGSVNELVVFGAKSTADCVASLDNSAYHLVHVLSPYVDMGIYFNAGNGGESACVVMLGVSTNSPGQFAAVDQYVRYPANTQLNLTTTFYNQAERPIPAPDLNGAGRPVLFSFYNMSNKVLAAKDVVIHVFAMEDQLGNKVPVRILAFPGVQSDGPVLVSDVNMGATGYVLALPMYPLQPNTIYKMTINATVTGKLVNQQWSFTTGHAN